MYLQAMRSGTQVYGCRDKPLQRYCPGVRRKVMRGKRTILAIGLVVLGSGSAYAQKPHRDPPLERGEHVARLVCSACHVVAENQEFPPLLNPPAPSFMEIADRPGTS